MDMSTLIRVLARRRHLRRHEHWDAADIAGHQAGALAALRAHAVSQSQFYQRFHRGLEGAPLHALPVLTKAELMASFD